jgi:hypothetical protein
MARTAVALNCTLGPSPAESSTRLLIDQVLTALDRHGSPTRVGHPGSVAQRVLERLDVEIAMPRNRSPWPRSTPTPRTWPACSPGRPYPLPG